MIFLGPPGVGKTHLAVALGLQAISQGVGTYFIAAHDLVNDLRRAHAENRLERRLRVYLSPRLLIIDEMGHIPFANMEAQVFFQMISKRYERGTSLIRTSNIRGESYRLREKRKAASWPPAGR